MQIQKTGNLNFLLIKKSYHNLSQIYKSEFQDIWIDLNQQVFDEFGVPDKLQQYFDLKKERLLIRAEKIQTGDRFLNNDINIINRQIEMLFSDGKPQNYINTIQTIEKFQGFKINSKDITVFEYHSYIQLMISNTPK